MCKLGLPNAYTEIHFAGVLLSTEPLPLLRAHDLFIEEIYKSLCFSTSRVLFLQAPDSAERAALPTVTSSEVSPVHPTCPPRCPPHFCTTGCGCTWASVPGQQAPDPNLCQSFAMPALLTAPFPSCVVSRE